MSAAVPIGTGSDSDPPEWTLPAWQLPIAQLCDSAAPTGAFSHSLGLETYVTEDGAFKITDGEGFASWLRAMIVGPLTFGDALAIRLIAQAGGDEARRDEAVRVDRTLHASALAAQVRAATVAIGKRTLDIARDACPTSSVVAYASQVETGSAHGHPAVVVALAGADLGAPTPELIAAYLHGVAAALTQNAVRLIPLGPRAGQQALAKVRTSIEASLARVAALSASELGATSPGLEIAQMRHEYQHARMYMS